jgi:hypothetical protein
MMAFLIMFYLFKYACITFFIKLFYYLCFLASILLFADSAIFGIAPHVFVVLAVSSSLAELSLLESRWGLRWKAISYKLVLSPCAKS